MTFRRDRILALLGALLFLITSSALTIGVIYTLIQQHNASKSSSTTVANHPSHQTTSQVNHQPIKLQKAHNSNLAGTKMQNFTPITTKLTKLQYTDLKVGSGPVVKPGATVKVDYVGALADTGVIFDASADHGGPVSLSLNQVIAGWSQGIPGMRVGGTRRLLIPSNLAYGKQAQPGIPANSDLVFDVTVVGIQ